MVKALAVIPLVAGAWLAGAWGLMVEIGIAHGSWWPIIPTIGYVTALKIAAIASVVAFVRGCAGAFIRAVGK